MNLRVINLELSKRWKWWSLCRFPWYFEQMEELLLSDIECTQH